MGSRIAGRWQIVEMDLWDREDIDLLGPAFIEITRDGAGSFRFIAVEGDLDCREAHRDALPAVEFSWSGTDDGDVTSGRGWAERAVDGSLNGHIFFHLGDDSGFRAVPTGTSS